MSHKLIVTVVPQYEGELIVNAARDACCPGGTVLRGRETSENGLVQLLGFGENRSKPSRRVWGDVYCPRATRSMDAR